MVECLHKPPFYELFFTIFNRPRITVVHSGLDIVPHHQALREELHICGGLLFLLDFDDGLGDIGEGLDSLGNVLCSVGIAAAGFGLGVYKSWWGIFGESVGV